MRLRSLWDNYIGRLVNMYSFAESSGVSFNKRVGYLLVATSWVSGNLTIDNIKDKIGQVPSSYYAQGPVRRNFVKEGFSTGALTLINFVPH